MAEISQMSPSVKLHNQMGYYSPWLCKPHLRSQLLSASAYMYIKWLHIYISAYLLLYFHISIYEYIGGHSVCVHAFIHTYIQVKEIGPGCSLEGLMLKLKLQYFGHLMRRVDSLEKTLMLGAIGGRRRRDNRGWDGWMASPTQWTWIWVDSGGWWWTGRPGVLRFMGSKESDTTERLNWTGELRPHVLWDH